MYKQLMIVAILFVGISLSGLSQKKQNQEPTKVHFVGNSYTFYNNLPQVLYAFAESRSISMLTSKTVVGGAELREHWNNGSDDKPSWNVNTREILKNGKYDFVVLQDQSMMPIDYPDSTLKYIRLFSEMVKIQGTEPILYMTWARERIPQLQEQLTAVYTEAALANGIKIAPVGEAFKMARELRPDMQLFASDGTHPSSLGTYLAACTFFAAITGEDPTGLIRIPKINDQFGEPIILMNIDIEDAFFLQSVARSTIEKLNNKKLSVNEK